MNESIATPANPYITLTRLHWQPYVELLLRTVSVEWIAGDLSDSLLPIYRALRCCIRGTPTASSW